LHKKYDRKIPKQQVILPDGEVVTDVISKLVPAEVTNSQKETTAMQECGVSLKTLRKRHLFNLPFGTANWAFIPHRMRKRSAEFLLKEWMGAFTSIFLYPYFLSYWKLGIS
jgi:hypothetical protein